MYLRELRINGFKSFADPVKLDLRPGMTAIVGPNGCGKSNTADAIRWVLGEQSSKSLRAGSMQDVIFQGTTNRKPLGLCEVSLIFTDCEKQLGTAHNEVEVTRRVVRDGGSQYYINGKVSRLKDIQNLFMDTGIGQVSYSFMLQGQIDKILSTNPTERRTIFEEAAGISKYKAQRKEALTKLAQVDANLARVTDVIEEVSRQITSLKRQATKAFRYKKIRHRLKHLDLAVRSRKFSALMTSVEDTNREAEGLRTIVIAARHAVDAINQSLEQLKEERSMMAEKLQVSQQQVYDLRSRKDQANNLIELSTLRAEDSSGRIEALYREIESLKEERGELQAKVEGELRHKAQQLSLFSDSDSDFKTQNESLLEVEARIAEAEGVLAQRKQKLMGLESSLSRFRSNCTTLEIESKTFQNKTTQLLEQLQILGDEHGELEAKSISFEQAHRQRLQERNDAEAQLKEAQETLDLSLMRFRKTQEDIRFVDRDLAGIIARKGVLEDLQRKLEGFSDAAKAILQGKLASSIEAQEYALLSDLLTVSSAYSPALELFLGVAVDAIHLRSTDKLLPLLEALESGGHGRVSLHLSMGNPPGAVSVEGLIPMRSLVSFGEENAVLFEPLFRGVYLCESLYQFMEIWKTNPNLDFQCVITQSGEYVDRRGFVFAGKAKGKKDSFLHRQIEIETLTEQQEQSQQRMDALRSDAAAIQELLDLAEETMNVSRGRLQELSGEVLTIETQLGHIRESLMRNRQLYEKQQSQIDGLEEEKEAVGSKLELAQQTLEHSEKEIEQQKQSIYDAEEALQVLREERDVCRDSFNRIRLEMAEKKQRLALLEQGVEQIKQRITETELLQERKTQEIALQQKQIEVFKTETSLQAKIIEDIETQLGDVRKGLDEDREALMLVDERIKKEEATVTEKRSEYEETTAKLNKLEVLLATKRSESEYLFNETHKEYESNLSEIDWKLELWQAGDSLPDRIKIDMEDDSLDLDAPIEREGTPTDMELESFERFDWDSAIDEIETLRSRVSGMGAVNLVAIEEYKDLRERYDFLKTQSDDLWNAKEQLVSAIDEINGTSLELFEKTFDKIRENFHYTFDALFGGGEADLELVNGEDPLESGIEITARPPGTRLKSLALLSGGQKTMTAVALLFAIYMVKPSPFCVLDEIDAPLDDANIGRFCEMLKQFLQYSQFLIITHSKRTIASADTIYGVTMQERGVSKLVSMRFQQAVESAEKTLA
ncbi:MAG: chromosome segregation protein SMC [Opitutales bacterium]|nr:chromosome segregation protein SMC [Opitutales bacterium]